MTAKEYEEIIKKSFLWTYIQMALLIPVVVSNVAWVISDFWGIIAISVSTAAWLGAALVFWRHIGRGTGFRRQVHALAGNGGHAEVGQYGRKVCFE